jgi:replicative DNA helicase
MALKDTIKKATNIASPVTNLIPDKDTKRKLKKIGRKFDNYMSEKFPNATKKLQNFDDKIKAKSDKFNEKADVYMEEKFPKIKKFVERTFNSKGGLIKGKPKLAKKGWK